MSIDGELRQIPPEQLALLDDESVIEGLKHSAAGISVGGAWEALHWILCGGQPTGVSAILGGIAVDHGDVGYGPAQVLEPEEVAGFAEALATLSEEQLRALYRPDAMSEDHVYGANIEFEELVRHIATLRAFYRDAAAKGCGMLQFLT